MKSSKSLLRKSFLLKRKNEYFSEKKFNFNLVFNLIKKHFNKKKITIAGYYPTAFEVNILNFLENSLKRNFIVSLPFIKSSKSMCFKKWIYKEPLNVNKFGIPEPKKTNKEIIPDLVLVPLVAYDKNLNRIGYGRGYYDRCLQKVSKIKKNSVFLGVAFSFQESRRIPTNKHDFKLDYIFTEQGIIGSN